MRRATLFPGGSNRQSPKSGKPRQSRKPYWLIVKCRSGRLEVLTVDLDGTGEALPVFSFEEEAEMFVHLGGYESSGWRARESCATGELISMLLAPCAEVKRVALDPLPLPLGSAMLPFVSVTRSRFVQELMG